MNTTCPPKGARTGWDALASRPGSATGPGASPMGPAENEPKRSQPGSATALSSPQDQWSASTEPRRERPSAQVIEEVAALLSAATEESFEDGMESALSRGIEQVIRRHGRQAVAELTARIICETTNHEVASELLRWLGRMTHPQTLQARRWLLERTLFCSSPRVRDAAGLGLASLDDPHAILYLRQAIERELCPELREDLRLTLTQLEATARAVHSPQGA